MGTIKTVLRVGLFLVLTLVGIVAGWFLFLGYPESTRELLGIVLLLLAVPMIFKVSGTVVRSLLTPYNVAEVGVTGPITRDNSPGPLGKPMGASANALVDRIEQAEADSSVDALLVRLNTPGGEVIPSEDIKHAIERFDGPTIGYATDTCASGGYEIASGCDEFWAREASIVGSIGVLGSRVTASELADKLGLQYEQLTAGEYKDAGMPIKDLEAEEREYLQGIVDGYYDWFVGNVAARRDLTEEEIRDTEARVYLGKTAAEMGLVDELGTREDVENRLEERIGKSPEIESFDPELGLAQRLNTGAQRVAYAAGAGIVGTLRDDDQRFRLQ